MSVKVTKRSNAHVEDVWPGWRFFSEHRCLIGGCNDELTYNNTTSNFKRHLARKHKAIYAELERRKDELAIEPIRPLVPSSQSVLSDFYDATAVEKGRELSRISSLSSSYVLTRSISFARTCGPSARWKVHFSAPACGIGLTLILGEDYVRGMQRGRPRLPRFLFDRDRVRMDVKHAAKEFYRFVESTSESGGQSTSRYTRFMLRRPSNIHAFRNERPVRACLQG